MLNHIKYMKMAITLAKKASYSNPFKLSVGCVIVKNNEIIGEGYYDSSVSIEHAETKAINNAKEDVSGASLYVTLEPCFHTGKTPPCVDYIIANKIKEVIIPFKDPNYLVNGKSIIKLEQAGIKVIKNVLAEECYNLNEEFLNYYISKIPLITAKWASSLDGKLSTYTYNSKWITNEAAREKSHTIRGQNNAVLIGANTLYLDDPLLNVRYNLKEYNSPIRIILSHNSNINIKAALWSDNSAPNWLILPENYINDDNIKILRNKNVKIIGIPKFDEFIDIKLILQELGNKGISSVMVEGGPSTLSQFLEKRVVNKLEIFMAPVIIGGDITAANFKNKNFQKVSDSEQFNIINHKVLDGVVWFSLISNKYIEVKKEYIKYLLI